MFTRKQNLFVNMEETAADPNTMPDVKNSSNVGGNPQNMPSANNNQQTQSNPQTNNVNQNNTNSNTMNMDPNMTGSVGQQQAQGQTSDDAFGFDMGDLTGGVANDEDFKKLTAVSILALPSISEKLQDMTNIFDKMGLKSKHPLVKKIKIIKKLFEFFIDNFDHYKQDSTKIIKLFNLALIKIAKQVIMLNQKEGVNKK